jgi:hypothetical protein
VKTPINHPVAADYTCPVCGGMQLRDFYQIARVPVHVSFFASSAKTAADAPQGKIRLSHCGDCGFIFNRDHEPSIVEFEPGYEASLIHSESYRNYIEQLTRRLADSYRLQGKNILEIGCGDGSFLRTFCKNAKADGIGIDPTIKKPGTESSGENRLELIRDYFSESYAELVGDFICCLSVFEDIPDPLGFLTMLRQAIGERTDTRLYFEVPDIAHTLGNQLTWGIYYEQCNFFTRSSLEFIFRKSGFEVIRSGNSYQDNQYAWVEAKPATDATLLAMPPVNLVLVQDIEQFAVIQRQNIQHWQARFAQFQLDDTKVVIWGSGGKGVGFLNALPSADIIKHVVDINPIRQGQYIPGSAQRVIAPQELSRLQPDVIIITNPFYQFEIEQMIAEIGSNSQVLTL